MQISINKISFKSYNNAVQNNNKSEVQDFSNSNITSVPLSNYEVGQAILNRNNITFRNLAMPIEVTDKYNKKTKGKDHLDLPNIHVYEYPDTNLQVFINTVNTTSDKNIFKSSLALYNKGIKNDSVIKKKLLMELMDKSFNKNGINVQLNEKYASFINIDFNSDKPNFNQIALLNKLVSKPNFSEQALELSKENLIKMINSEKYQKETAEFKNLIDDSLLDSKEDTIKNIKNISMEDIYSYYSEILNNTEVQYAITVDKSFLNENKNLFYSSLNSNLTHKFKEHSDKNIESLEPISNKNNIRYYDNKNAMFLNFHYPVQVKSNKDYLAYKYLTLLEFFWGEPYIANDFDVRKYTLPMELKKSEINPTELGYLNFSFTPKGNENISSTDEAITTFNAILEVLYDEKLSSNTLESIKDCDKQFFNEQLNKDMDVEKAHELLKIYHGDVFKLYEMVDDIKIEDIRKLIEQTLFEQKPIISINEDKNPYSLKG